MKVSVLHQDAERELAEAAASYEARAAGLGADFLDEFERAVETIRQAPDRWSTFKGTEFRKRRLKRFPYTVNYLDLADRVWIAAVAHQKRRPGYWSGRSPE